MKKSSLIYFIAILLCVSACGTGSSPSEEKTKKDIASIYLAETTFEDIFNGTLAGLENINVKNVYVAQSPILDTMNINLSRNSIAAITYENLSDEEKDNYDYIGIIISQKDKEENPFSFPMATLEKITTSKDIAYQFAESIKDKSYSNLASIMKVDGDPAQTVKMIDDYFSENTKRAGKITNYYYHGAGEGEHQSKTYFSHVGTFVYANGMKQNFFVNVFDGASVIEGYNISSF